jgi:N12 class adenine-specific DNA methylase
MAVVINEFEVLPSTKPAEQKNAEAKENGSEAKKPNDAEFEQMLEKLRERSERVRAH